MNTNVEPLDQYTNLGGHLIPYPDPVPDNVFWIQRIIDALVEKGHLFRFVQKDGHGYVVEA